MKKQITFFSIALISAVASLGAKSTVYKERAPEPLPVGVSAPRKLEVFSANRGPQSIDALNKILENNPAVVLDFCATWCGPCKELLPVIEKLAQENPRIKFLKVDIDQYKEIANKYRIKSVPTVVYIKDGKIVKQESGFKSSGAIKKNLNLLGSS